MSYLQENIDLSTVKEIFESKFETAILGIEPTAVITLENQVSAPPADPAVVLISFIVRATGAVKDGSGSYNRAGIATAEVFCPLGEGWKRMDNIYKTIRKSFQDAQWKDNVLSVTDVTPVNDGPDGSFYRQDVLIGFRFNESPTEP